MYTRLISADEPRAARRTCPTPAIVTLSLCAGALITIAVLILAIPSASWGLPQCGPGWTELGTGCVSGESAPVGFHQAASNCSVPATLIPGAAAKQLAALLRTYSRGAVQFIWVKSDGIRSCVRVSDGSAGIDDACGALATRVCHYQRTPGSFARFAMATRATLGLP
ncbi:membrane protein UL45 [Bovine alphaherpesvirus 2]|uniref:Envelope protein UL45 n=1 Tax=Bovine alphaherpesvirus 2 TaxID=10295 RepID=A0A7T1L7J9_9ALPH|nr:membrane protein UL45 [Bovine alphaherpesvirus 2]